MKDNRGITLIELIVVMLIMAVLSIGATVSINLIGYGSSLSTAKRIKTGLEYVQLQNMSKAKSYYLVIRQEDSSYFLAVEEMQIAPLPPVVKSQEKLKLNNGTITFHYNDGSNYNVGSMGADGKPIELKVSFYKDTGGVVKKIDDTFIKTITVSAAGGSDIIQLVQTTGKVIMK